MKQHLLTLLTGLLLGAAAQAQSINYYFYGNATGNLGGIPFENTPFTIQVIADQNDIGLDEFEVLSVDDLASVFEIQNVAVGVFTSNMSVFAIEDEVGFSRTDSAIILELIDAGLVGYNLRELPAPVPIGFATTRGQFFDIPTDAGLLTFNFVDNMTFSTSPIPEPSAALLGLGAAGMMLTRRRRAVRA